MALCRRCALNGQRRDGGDIGVCKQHARTKCQICRAPSLGAELCSAHAHQDELARWKAQATFRAYDPSSEVDLAALRREKLIDAKFLAHLSVEQFFRSLLQVSEALYGQAAQDDEQRKAA